MAADEEEIDGPSRVPARAPAGERTTTGGNDNLLWRQYVLLVDLYRYFIDLVWKVSIWFYTAAGVSSFSALWASG